MIRGGRSPFPSRARRHRWHGSPLCRGALLPADLRPAAGDETGTTDESKPGSDPASAAWAADLCGLGLRYVVGAERLPYAVEVVPLGPWIRALVLRTLSDVAHRDRQARRVAESIRAFQAGHPGDPVFLVAKSGGAGIAVKALEQLDEDSVERAILLAPALSPRYDLTAALRAVAPGDRRLLVAARRGDPRRRHPAVRHDRSGQDRRRGPGGFRRARARRARRGASAPVRQAPPGALAASDGRPGPSGRPLRSRICPGSSAKHVVPLLRADESAEVAGPESRVRGQADTRWRRYPNGPSISQARCHWHAGAPQVRLASLARVGSGAIETSITGTLSRTARRSRLLHQGEITPKPGRTGGAGPPRMDLPTGPGPCRASGAPRRSRADGRKPIEIRDRGDYGDERRPAGHPRRTTIRDLTCGALRINQQW